jgi:TPR repeat protein
MGNPDAQTEVGLCYLKGRGVEQSPAQAMQWFTKAAKFGDGPAMSFLGRMYAEGNGVPRDYAKAIDWFQRAADAGDRVG